MHRTLIIAALALSAACNAEVEVAHTPAVTAAPESCSESVCIDAGAAADLAKTQQALAACVPDEDASEDASGLRIGGVTVSADGAALRVTLVNVSPHGVMTYPGVRVRAIAGAEVPEPMAGQLYGIFGCAQTVVEVPVKWGGAKSARFVAEATNDLGKSVLSQVSFTVAPPKDAT